MLNVSFMYYVVFQLLSFFFFCQFFWFCLENQWKTFSGGVCFLFSFLKKIFLFFFFFFWQRVANGKKRIHKQLWKMFHIKQHEILPISYPFKISFSTRNLNSVNLFNQRNTWKFSFLRVKNEMKRNSLKIENGKWNTGNLWVHGKVVNINWWTRCWFFYLFWMLWFLSYWKKENELRGM